MGYVDGNLISHYDSEMGRTVPRVDWMAANLDQQYWDTQTQIGQSNQQVDRVNLDMLRVRYNESGSECWLGWGSVGLGRDSMGQESSSPLLQDPALPHATAPACAGPSLLVSLSQGSQPPCPPARGGPGCPVPAPQCLGSRGWIEVRASGHPSPAYPPPLQCPGPHPRPGCHLPAPHHPHGSRDPQNQRGSCPQCPRPLPSPWCSGPPWQSQRGFPHPIPSPRPSHGIRDPIPAPRCPRVPWGWVPAQPRPGCRGSASRLYVTPRALWAPGRMVGSSPAGA